MQNILIICVKRLTTIGREATCRALENRKSDNKNPEKITTTTTTRTTFEATAWGPVFGSRKLRIRSKRTALCKSLRVLWFNGPASMYSIYLCILSQLIAFFVCLFACLLPCFISSAACYRYRRIKDVQIHVLLTYLLATRTGFHAVEIYVAVGQDAFYRSPCGWLL